MSERAALFIIMTLSFICQQAVCDTLQYVYVGESA
jgi:hypothetical protein